MKILLILFLALHATACDSGIKVKTKPVVAPLLSEKNCESNPEASSCTAPSGEKFTDGMTINVDGRDVKVAVISPTEAVFIMPADIKVGKIDALAQRYEYGIYVAECDHAVR